MTQDEEAHFFFTIQSFHELVKTYKDVVWYEIDTYFPELSETLQSIYGKD